MSQAQPKRAITVPANLFPNGVPPGTYAMTAAGDCMAPEISPGDVVLLSTVAPCENGDLVALHPSQPGISVQLKRLAMKPLRAIEACFHPDDTCIDLVVVEQANPPARLAVKALDLSVMHKVIAVVWQADAVVKELPPAPPVPPRRTRKRRAAA